MNSDVEVWATLLLSWRFLTALVTLRHLKEMLNLKGASPLTYLFQDCVNPPALVSLWGLGCVCRFLKRHGLMFVLQPHERLSNIKSPTRTGCLCVALPRSSFLSMTLCSFKWQSLILLLLNTLRILFDYNVNIFVPFSHLGIFFIASVKNTTNSFIFVLHLAAWLLPRLSWGERVRWGGRVASDHLTFDPHIFSFLLPFPFKEVLLVKSALSTSPRLLPTDKGSERRGNMTVRGMQMPVFSPLSTWIQPSPKPVLLDGPDFSNVGFCTVPCREWILSYSSSKRQVRGMSLKSAPCGSPEALSAVPTLPLTLTLPAWFCETLPERSGAWSTEQRDRDPRSWGTYKFRERIGKTKHKADPNSYLLENPSVSLKLGGFLG